MGDFLAELERYGPDGAAGPKPLDQAEEYARRLATEHYENFPVLTRFVPAGLRQHFANVYAYCRWSDDLADEVGDRERSLVLLDWWQEELDRCYRGEARHPVMVALAPTIDRFAIPRAPFLDLLAAFRRDQRQFRYATFADLRDYSRCSADPVGRLVLYLCERYSDERAALSDSVCTGLQLVNFWQDVGIDLDKGRIYLPLEDCARFGVSESELLERRHTPEFAELLSFEVGRAEALLRAGLPLGREMPGRLKLVIAMFAQGGLTIARKLRRVDFDIFSRRPTFGKSDGIGVVLRSLGGLAFGARGSSTVRASSSARA